MGDMADMVNDDGPEDDDFVGYVPPPPPPLKPPVRWAGGKTALIPQLLPKMPEEIEIYCEPFVGGGAMALAVSEKYDTDLVLGDLSTPIYLVWRALSDNPGGVIAALKPMLSNHELDPDRTYIDAQDQWNNGPECRSLALEWRAALVLYLNRSCFNGLWRENAVGLFNVPRDTTKRTVGADFDNLRALGRWLQVAPVTIIHGDFTKTIHRAADGTRTFVFADPPYDEAYDGYVAGGFKDHDQVRLRDCLKELHKAGGKFMVTNSDTPRVRELYRGLTIESISQRVNINSDGAKRGKISDLVIRNYR